MKKEDIVDLIIEDLTQEGLGVGHAEGMAVFVKDTVIGDEISAKLIKLKKNYAFGRLMEIKKPSPDRVEPKCPVARQCGGCQIQAMDYRAQLAFKAEKVKNCLTRIGGLTDLSVMEPIMGMEEPWMYRNKAQFPIAADKNGRPIAGFYAGRTHSIVANTDCAIGIPENKEILEILLAFMEEFHVQPYNEETGKGLVRHCLIRKGFKTGEIMVCLVLNGKKLPHREIFAERLQKIAGMTSIVINVNTEKTNVILGRETILVWGREYIEDLIGNVRYRISAKSFYQVNPVQTEKLYGTALEFAGLTGNETVWDLYCGIGTITLFLAQNAKQVRGVEIVPEAIADAKQNAELNGIKNAEFFVGKAEEVLPQKYKEEDVRADVIVVDPPRKGCDEALLETILKMAPERVVYVSCDPATLARDLKVLQNGGYKVERVRPCDMFPHSVHVETVCLLSKKHVNKNDYVEIGVDAEEYYKIKEERK